MKFQHVLIVTYGRTGSTLLQGLLNDVDKTIVRGENFNFCFGLFKSYQSLKKLLKDQGQNGESPSKPFYGSFSFDEDKFLKSSYELLKEQLGIPPSCDFWGFKEIRYTPNGLEDKWGYKLKEYLAFLNILLPNTAFIFLTRDHKAVLKSAFWKSRDQNEALNDILCFEESARKWSQSHSNSFWIDYNEVVENGDVLKDMYEFLGLSYNFDAVRQTLGVEHSYAGKKENLANVSSEKTLIKKGKKILCNVETSSELEAAFVDNDGWVTVRENGFTSIGGVVLLSNSLDISSYDIYAIVDGKEYLADWQLPSPKIAILFPDNKHSSNARFHVKNLLVGYNSDISIVLRSKA
ncbi:sulfotransferase [Halomonas sp. IOP_6]|uniref:sulfotransferase n=1 Tax=Halomonas sp. IOP_6 TaxID=2876583 RepID=UPI001E40F419|nr:sulfotransferase [Halomonas sp. IOP_6]MCD6003899.1 sulfotransferase [Halomonas sp. IOP_6]